MMNAMIAISRRYKRKEKGDVKGRLWHPGEFLMELGVLGGWILGFMNG
jgi:hypothetical protein